MEFTEEQIEDFKQFERQTNVPSREYGLTDPRSSGLSTQRHLFVVRNYTALRSLVTGCDHQGR